MVYIQRRKLYPLQASVIANIENTLEIFFINYFCKLNIIKHDVLLTIAIAETCRAGKKSCEWHVCHPLWYLAGQWGGIWFSFVLFLWVLDYFFFWSKDYVFQFTIIFSLEKTMRNLEIVLSGYENVEVVPSLFVFMGNFCSHPCNISFKSFSSLR